MTNKLPSHTTRYFARECYRLAIYNGIYRPIKSTTVQGVNIVCEMSGMRDCVIVSNAETRELIKIEPVRKSWGL